MTRLKKTMTSLAIVAALGMPFILAEAQTGSGPPAAAQGSGSGPGPGYGPGMMGRGGYGSGGYGPGMMWGRGGGWSGGPGPGMMTWMYGGGDDGAYVDYLDGRLAFVKAELKITSQQTPLWDKFAETVRANAKTINERRRPFFDRSYWSEPLPQRLDQQEKVMTANLDALRQTSAAVKPLYAALDEAQKKTADSLLGSPMMGALGMM